MVGSQKIPFPLRRSILTKKLFTFTARSEPLEDDRTFLVWLFSATTSLRSRSHSGVIVLRCRQIVARALLAIVKGHAVLDQVTTSALDDSGGDQPAVGQCGGVVKRFFVREQVVGTLVDRHYGASPQPRRCLSPRVWRRRAIAISTSRC